MTEDTCVKPLPSLLDYCYLEKISGHGLFSEISQSVKYHGKDEVGRDLWNVSGPTSICSYTKLSSFTFSGSPQNFGMHWD